VLRGNDKSLFRSALGPRSETDPNRGVLPTTETQLRLFRRFGRNISRIRPLPLPPPVKIPDDPLPPGRRLGGRGKSGEKRGAVMDT
jgi:hypothetical protein